MLASWLATVRSLDPRRAAISWFDGNGERGRVTSADLPLGTTNEWSKIDHVTRALVGCSGRAMTPDLVGVVEAGYQVALPDEATWLQGILDAVRPCLDHGAGAYVTTYRINAAGHYDLAQLRAHGLPDSFSEAMRQLGARMPPSDVERMLRRPVGLMSDVLRGPAQYSLTADLAVDLGVADVLGIVARDPIGLGAMIGVPLSKALTLDRGTIARWSRIAAHVAAGLRLRRRFEQSPAEASLDHADAVLDPGGKVVHAQGDAAGPVARAALREAARAVDRARASLRRKRPDDAVEIWRGLVDGRWSLVDAFERDGRRYLVARDNPPPVRVRRALSPIEERVVGYAALGHANKLIAYELGVSQSAVSRCLARAAKKLGLASRVALVAALGAPARPRKRRR